MTTRARVWQIKHRLSRVRLMDAAFGAAGAILVAFVILPLLRTLWGIGPEVLWRTLLDAQVAHSLALTVSAAACATALAGLTGVPLAYVLARREFAGKRWVEGVVKLPIVVPHTAAGIALVLVFGRQGVLGHALAGVGVRFTDAFPGIVVGMCFVSLPFLVSAACEAFEAVNPDMERVALTLGATPWEAFRYVTLPLAARGILAGAVTMWGRGLSEFGAVVILAYNPKIMPVLVYERFEGFGLRAAQPVAVILIAASLAIFVAIQALMGRTEPDWVGFER